MVEEGKRRAMSASSDDRKTQKRLCPYASSALSSSASRNASDTRGCVYAYIHGRKVLNVETRSKMGSVMQFQGTDRTTPPDVVSGSQSLREEEKSLIERFTAVITLRVAVDAILWETMMF